MRELYDVKRTRRVRCATHMCTLEMRPLLLFVSGSVTKGDCVTLRRGHSYPLRCVEAVARLRRSSR